MEDKRCWSDADVVVFRPRPDDAAGLHVGSEHSKLLFSQRLNAICKANGVRKEANSPRVPNPLHRDRPTAPGPTHPHRDRPTAGQITRRGTVTWRASLVWMAPAFSPLINGVTFFFFWGGGCRRNPNPNPSEPLEVVGNARLWIYCEVLDKSVLVYVFWATILTHPLIPGDNVWCLWFVFPQGGVNELQCLALLLADCLRSAKPGGKTTPL